MSEENDKVEKGLPKCKKLEIDGNFYNWSKDMELHFVSANIHSYLTEKPTQESLNIASKKRKEARCRRG